MILDHAPASRGCGTFRTPLGQNENAHFALKGILRRRLDDSVVPVINTFLDRGLIGGLVTHIAWSAIAGAGIAWAVLRRDRSQPVRVGVGLRSSPRSPPTPRLPHSDHRPADSAPDGTPISSMDAQGCGRPIACSAAKLSSQ